MGDEFKVYAAKRYMEHVSTVKNRIAAIEGEIEELDARITGLRAIQYTDMPGSPNAYGDGIPDGLAQKEQLKGSLETECAEWYEVDREARRAIHCLGNGRHVQLLAERYLLNRTWKEIAFSLGRNGKNGNESLDETYVKRELHEASLSALYETMPEEWRRNFPKAEI